MIVVTKESLIRGNFSLSTPIKCSCGMLHPRNKPRADWLAQRGGCCDRPQNFLLLGFFMGLHGTVRGCRWTFDFCRSRSRFRRGARWTFLPLLVFAVFARWMFSRSCFRWKFLAPLLVFGLDDDWVRIFIRPAGLQHKQNTRTNGLRSKRACTGPQQASTGGHR